MGVSIWHDCADHSVPDTDKPNKKGQPKDPNWFTHLGQPGDAPDNWIVDYSRKDRN